jgi:hypothetical protein
MGDKREEGLIVSEEALGYYMYEADELRPDEEALAWVMAARLGLTDAIGGAEWERRCREGHVSVEAEQLLCRIDLTLRQVEREPGPEDAQSSSG